MPTSSSSKPGSTGSEIGLALVSLGLADAVDSKTFITELGRVGANFGIDYGATRPNGEPTNENLKARTLFRVIRLQGWTRRQFLDRVNRFLATAKWPGWTIAEFLEEADGPKVYPFAWYQAQVAESRANAQAIGCYDVPGQDGPMWGWKHEIGDQLQPYTGGGYKAGDGVTALELKEAPTDDAALALQLMAENAELRERIQSAEADCDRLLRRLERTEREYRYTERELLGAISDVCNGTRTIEDLQEEFPITTPDTNTKPEDQAA